MGTGFNLELEESKGNVDIDPFVGYEIKEVPPFGTLIFGSIPINDFVFLNRKFPKGAIISSGIANYYKCNMAIAISSDLAKQWEKAIEKKLEEKYSKLEDRWWNGTDTGRSSKTIFKAMVYNLQYIDGDIPHDPDDFGRCYRLIEKFPNWKTTLHIVSDINPQWLCFIENWGKLTKLYEEEFESASCPKLYEELKRLAIESKRAEDDGK